MYSQAKGGEVLGMYSQAESREVIRFNHQLYRSFLYCSGARLEHFEKALATRADSVTIDLEDSIPLKLKEAARRETAELLGSHDGVGRRAVFVKTNPMSSPYGAADLEALAGCGIAGFRIPKVDTVEEVAQIDRILDQAGFRGCVQLMIETARGVLNLERIASHGSRTSLMIVGMQDLCNHLGCTREHVAFVLSQTVVCSRAAGLLPPVLSVVTSQDPQVLRDETIGGKERGCWGRLCVHPSQVDAINELFTPSEREVARAVHIIQVIREAEEGGRTAIRDEDGNYLSVWAVDQANRTLAIAEALSRLDA
jgi:citrate lyase subunit beta/citryl-CoA lyase